MWFVITKFQFLDSCAFHTPYRALLASSVVNTLSRSWLTSLLPNPSVPSLSFDLSVAFHAIEHFAFLEHFLHTASRKCFSSYQLPSHQSSLWALPSLNYKFGTCHGYVPSTSTRIKSDAALQLLTFNTPLREFRIKNRTETPCIPEKLGRCIFREIFSGANFISPILTSPLI